MKDLRNALNWVSEILEREKKLLERFRSELDLAEIKDWENEINGILITKKFLLEEQDRQEAIKSHPFEF